MKNKLSRLVNLVKHLLKECLDHAIETLENMKGEVEKKKSKSRPTVRTAGGNSSTCAAIYGAECGKSFSRTTGTVLYKSQSGEAVWKQVIRDTADGTSIDRTALSLGMSRETVFNMRHKALFCLETGWRGHETALSGVCESDETYILESLKGEKLPADYRRAARKHGAVSSQEGISDEYMRMRRLRTRREGVFAGGGARKSPQGGNSGGVHGENQ